MADTAPVAPKAVKVKKATKPKKVASHPPYSTMIKEAITSLKERGGSSRQAILKYIVNTYKVADDKSSGAHVKLALKRDVVSGTLKQSKGTGASGSFKLGGPVKAEKKKPKVKKAAKKAVKKPATKKTTKPKSPKKKTVKPKKSAEKKKPKTVKPKTVKSPKKAKSPKKPATKKPVKAKKAKTPKKAAKK